MNETTIELKDVIKTLKKRRKLIISVFLGMTIAVAVLSLAMSPTFEAQSSLRVKQPKGLADSQLADAPVGMANIINAKQLMATYAEILKSQEVVETAFARVESNEEASYFQKLINWSRSLRGLEPVQSLPKYNDMLKRITTQPIKDTEILEVRAQGDSPAEAQLLANTLVNTFIEKLTSLSRSEQSAVREFIGQRLEESKKELEEAEKALEEYKRNEKMVAANDQTKDLVDRYSSIVKLQAENSVAQSAAEAKLNSTQQQLSQEKQGFVADSPLIQQYKSKLAELEVQLAGLVQKYTDKHPQVMEVRAAIAETKTKLDTEVTRTVNAEAPSMNPIHQGLLQNKIQAEAEIAAATAQAGTIDQLISDREKEIDKLPAKEQGLVRVMRDVAVTQEKYTMLAKRYEEARISEVMQPTEVQVVEIAALPDKPIKPKPLLYTAVAAVAGIFFGTGLALVSEYMTRTIRTAEDVRHYLDLPVLGSIPQFNGSAEPPQTGFWNKISNKFNLPGSEGKANGV
ncbi:MAG TPA: GumC family protein [Methylomusa anaerophila]|uniref:Tyrosine-protein kinase ptk n=1 Tax=Methylomusa anaerophila TaxID=1930071 RepID=A0A348AGD4_9FIRM|nr:GumC family protein [Methylomusa anaerophila]BBB90132.1 tyrosine-protein kinase ptk [Methylomusa anaerophila]HML88144.1 GumC family protein [Methylomusa anaerophila]